MSNLITDQCWLYAGTKNQDGYGVVWVPSSGKIFRAHRLIYESEVGPIPKGLQIDHLCRITCCINPDHLEAVTILENVRRQWIAKVGSNGKGPLASHCGNGHEFTPENTYWWSQPGRIYKIRHCRTCVKARDVGRREFMVVMETVIGEDEYPAGPLQKQYRNKLRAEQRKRLTQAIAAISKSTEEKG